MITSPVRSLNIIRRGNLLNSQHEVERLARGGQRALPLLLCHDSSRHKLRKETRHVSQKDLAMGETTALLQMKAAVGPLKSGSILGAAATFERRGRKASVNGPGVC